MSLAMPKTGAVRRGARRVEVCFALTSSTDIAFGLSLRRPRRRPRSRGQARRWVAAVPTATLYVIAALAPIAIASAGPELGRLASLVRPTAWPVVAIRAADLPRPVVHARGAMSTTFSDDPPALRAHVVAPGETLLAIAARYSIAPQTLAYNNRLADTRDLRVGQSLIVPPFDAALHVVREGETLAGIAAEFGVDADAIRPADVSTFDAPDTPGRLLIVPVSDARYPGFRLRVSEAPRVLAPRVRWPTDGVITQLFSPGHAGVDIAAPYGAPIVATESGTVSAVGPRGPGGLAVCVHHDWGLETCAYHASESSVELGERVVAGQTIARIGMTGVTTGPHVHWEARTNGVLVDPMTYAPAGTTAIRVGGATGSP
jgi:murein DD-endopeptidase MepM/ murein hydrolase activator NlpD